jgi:prepilin-type N-terminal cleavage/methylation domain-containing protein
MAARIDRWHAAVRELGIRRWRSDSGFTLIELLVVMAILGIVLGGLNVMLINGSSAELRLNRRVQAQQQVRMTLDKIRSDVHCASAAQAQTISTYAGLKLAVGSCSASTPTVSWCAVPETSGRFQLYRSTSTTAGVICTASDTTRLLVADNLTSAATLFATPTIPQFALQSVSVDFKVSVNPTVSKDVYRLTDSIVAQNSPRCTTSGGCTPTTVS